jgi:predicted metal-dependent phosphoesterase TrpH
LKYIDLHLHTFFSDGTSSPEEMVSSGLNEGLCAVAITDHDTVSGLDRAIRAAEAAGIEIVPGIELSSELGNTEIHILGYLIDHNDPRLLKELNDLRLRRRERAHNIVAKLNAIGVGIRMQSVLDVAAEGVISRLHIAKVLHKEGYAGSIGEAFQKYIGDNGPAYALGFRLSPQEAIKIIKAAGGIPVLAHPYSLRNDELVLELISFGIMGIEAYYPEHSQGETNFYLNLAYERKLLVTGGSDCHGDAKPQVHAGSVKVPYELLERIKEAKERLS